MKLKFNKASFFCILLIVFSATNSFSQTLPPTISGLQLWLTADSGVTEVSGKVSGWSDRSGKGNNAVQTVLGSRPSLIPNVINNLPVLRFDGSRILNGTTIPNLSTSPMSIFVVASGNAMSNSFNVLFDLGPYGPNGMFLSKESNSYTIYSNNTDVLKAGGMMPSSGFGKNIFGFEKQFGVSAEVYVNGTLKATSTDGKYINSFVNGAYNVGGDASYSGLWDGDIAEVILYDKALTVGERTSIEDYLNLKYAPPINLGPDKQTCSLPYVIKAKKDYYASYLWSNATTADSLVVNTFGSYSVTVTNIFGRTSTDTITLSQDVSSYTVNLGQDVTICSGQNIVLNAGSSYYQYGWSTGASSNYIQVNSSGTYSVTVTDCLGNITTDVIQVTVTPLPVFNLGNDTTVCYNQSYVLNPVIGNSVSYLWSTAATTSSIAINLSGQYSLTVTDATGCSYSDSKHISIDSTLATATLGADVSFCAGNFIALTQGANQTTFYLWSTGATTSSIVVQTTSNYSVIVTDIIGCSKKDTIHVLIKGIAPIPSFLANTICQGDKTSFSDLTTVFPPDSIVTWIWKFGDGVTSFLQNPLHTYSASGTYTSSLSVVSDSGCSAFIVKPVQVNTVPNAKFNVTSAPVCTGTSSQFMDVSTISSGTMTSWKWDFGDASSVSTLKNPSHTYSITGTYSIELIVTSGLGCKDTFASAVSVSQSPSALFAADTVCKGGATVFKDKSSGILSNWLWSFGDGANSTIKNASHTYSLAGTYTTSLLVTTTNGCTNSIAGVAVVNYLPSTGFKGNSACLHSPLQLTDISSVSGSTIKAWNWQFGIAGSSTLQNPLPVYSSPGTYSITLAATSAQGCFASATQTVSVKPLPIASFSLTPAHSFPQQAVNFSNLSTGGIIYHWFFGDGDKDSVQNAIHTYQDTGTYALLLVTQNSFGCIDSSVRNISVDVPILDIAVSDMFGVKSSNTVQVSTLLKNVGTMDVTTIELSAYLDDGTPTHEFWTGLVKPDSLINYPFHSSFELLNNAHSIVCVEVKKINGQVDNEISNNKKCYPITDEFTLLNPFPNPTIGEIHFLFITPDASGVKAEVYDSRGRIVATPFDGNASKGLNQINYNTIKLDKGMYVLKLSYKDKIVTKVFFKK
jgi:PKD repeat protein